MDMAENFWINWSGTKGKAAEHRPLIKTRSDFSIGSLSYVLIYGRNKNIIYRNNISLSIN